MDRSRLLAQTFRSLRHRNYSLYFAGQVVSFTGSWMQSTALMWLVFALTDDPLWPSLMLVAAVGPTLVLGPIGGSLADRYSKKKLIFATQAVFLLNAIVLTFVVASDSATPMLLLMLQFLNGLVQAIDLPARLAFVPELIPKEDLINAVGLNSLTFNVARAIGPAVAGLLFRLASEIVDAKWLPSTRTVMLGSIWCFTLNAISYLAVLLALVKIHVQAPVGQVARSAGRFWDGFRYLGTRPGMAALILLTGLLSIFGWPVFTLLPPYTKAVLGGDEKTFSFLVSAFGGGALIGALVTATYGTSNRRERFLCVGALGTLLGIGGLILAKGLPLAFASCGTCGFGLILYLSTGQSTMQLDSPDSSRGRVMALWAMMLSGSAIPGHLLAGTAAQYFSMPNVFIALFLGVATAVAGIVALSVSGLLRRERQ